MGDASAGVFTVGVFQDVAWAAKGLDALKRAGFANESLTVMAKEGADASALIERTLGSGGERLDAAAIGPLVGRGPLVAVLEGSGGDLTTLGMAGTVGRRGLPPPGPGASAGRDGRRGIH